MGIFRDKLEKELNMSIERYCTIHQINIKRFINRIRKGVSIERATHFVCRPHHNRAKIKYFVEYKGNTVPLVDACRAENIKQNSVIVHYRTHQEKTLTQCFQFVLANAIRKKQDYQDYLESKKGNLT